MERRERPMTAEREILTVKDVALELRCSSAHIYNVINGTVKGVTRLPVITIGRRKLVQRCSFEEWKRRNEQSKDGGIIRLPEIGIFGRRSEEVSAKRIPER
jgi:hypothetical protein